MNPCKVYVCDLAIKIKIAVTKIQYQFTNSPEASLQFAVLAQAIRDLNVAGETKSALKYLHSDMQHVQICGNNPEWIRYVLKQCEIDIVAMSELIAAKEQEAKRKAEERAIIERLKRNEKQNTIFKGKLKKKPKKRVHNV